jgi:hypothetical protein
LSTISDYWYGLLHLFIPFDSGGTLILNDKTPGDFFEGTLYQDIIEIINYHKFSGDQLQRLICLAHGYILYYPGLPTRLTSTIQGKLGNNSISRNVSIDYGILTSPSANEPFGSLWFTQDKSTTFGAIIEIALCLTNFVKEFRDGNKLAAAQKLYIYLQSLPIIVKPICSKHPIGLKDDLLDNPSKLFSCGYDTGIVGNKETGKDIKNLHNTLDTEWTPMIFNRLHIDIDTGEYAGKYFTGNLAFDFKKLWKLTFPSEPDHPQLPEQITHIETFILEVLNEPNLKLLNW